MSKRLVILGAGESGTGAALLAHYKHNQVFISDHGRIDARYKQELSQAGIPFEEGQHSEKKILAADEIVKSPGIPQETPIVVKAKQAGIPIIDEIELASRYTKAFIIGITGTNGKTTTTHLTYHILNKAGFNVGIAGNMGVSFARNILTCSYDYYVLELSCFQLEGIIQFKPNIACLLNITPDHLDRYGYQMAAYIQAKFRLLKNMGAKDAFIYNHDDLHIQQYIAQHPPVPRSYPISLKAQVDQGAYRQREHLCVKINQDCFEIPTKDLIIPGQHNQLNAMAASSLATLVQVEANLIRQSLQTFQGIPHRIEWLANIQGINFYNDSKSTTVDSVYAALATFTQPIIWLAGGYDKGNDYTAIKPLVQEKVKALICLGKNNKPLLAAFQNNLIPIQEVQDMQQAVNIALAQAQPGDIVLLSPACASFDLFKNFEDRGEQFKQAVFKAQSTYQQVS
jgi:UDP-N-acetylmuramoylalanine--D-glutamate ligase